jgi:antitoxin (DNA-binding transcriptional repressor) of toxin-antitoxin stability system
MTAVPIADFAARLQEYVRRAEQGEEFRIIDGQTVAQLGPSTAEGADDEPRAWRGVFADVPVPRPAAPLPPEPPLPPRRAEGPNLSWVPERGGGDE